MKCAAVPQIFSAAHFLLAFLLGLLLGRATRRVVWAVVTPAEPDELVPMAADVAVWRN